MRKTKISRILENKKNKKMLIPRNGSILKNIRKNIEKVLNLFLGLKTNVNGTMKQGIVKIQKRII